MWRTQVQRAIRELRFHVHPGTEHHGVWRWMKESMPEFRDLNPNTFFVVHQLDTNSKYKSVVNVTYGDFENTTEDIPTSGLSPQQFEEILRKKMEVGLTLERRQDTLATLDLPIEIVETHKYIQHLDDEF